MAGKTISQRLDELAERVGGHVPKTEHRLDDAEDELHALAAAVRKLEALPQQVADLKERVKQLEAVEAQAARHDERLKAIEKATDERFKAMEKTTEKGTDRVWQFAPMVISGVGVVVSLVSVAVAFNKRSLTAPAG